MENHAGGENKAGLLQKTGIVDVSKIYNGETSEINLEFQLEKEEDFGGEYVFEDAPVVFAKICEKAKGKNSAESYVALEINIKGKYTCVCARCAKELTKTLDINAQYGVTRQLVDDSDDYVEAPRGVLDVGELARTLFYLELPTRVLCKEDCRGLCPICGNDLNNGTCSCKPIDRGNRLTGLKKLLDNYEE